MHTNSSCPVCGTTDNRSSLFQLVWPVGSWVTTMAVLHVARPSVKEQDHIFWMMCDAMGVKVACSSANTSAWDNMTGGLVNGLASAVSRVCNVKRHSPVNVR